MKTPSSILGTLIELSELNFWGLVDAILIKHADDDDVIAWARANTRNSDEDLRDLSASIYETSTIVLEIDDVEKLLVMMREQLKNPYPRFWAACALIKRTKALPKSIVREAKVILREYLDDESVKDIAEKYVAMV